MRKLDAMYKIFVVALLCLLIGSDFVGSSGAVDASVTNNMGHHPVPVQENNAPATTPLHKVDPQLTSPSGDYRWLDVADYAYSQDYQDNYDYNDATVQVTYETTGTILQGSLTASNLKPNFAYQLKLLGTPGTAANERIGLSGRWWQEEWDGTKWTNGQNLNNKGDGSSPNPNDQTYFLRRDIVDPTSPTGKKYRFTGYMPIEYFITADSGSSSLSFEADSSYHVTWKTSQRPRTSSDGPLKTSTFYPEVSIFGEWERLPVGGVYLQPGNYACQIILTEESFHASCDYGNCDLAGIWAAAMGASISFNIDSPYTLTMASNPAYGGTTSPPVGDHFFYEQNEVVTIKAIPQSAYSFVNWTGEVAHPDWQTTTVVINSDKTVTAIFEYTGAEDPADGGCFIATAAYGSYFDNHVDTLRGFRDAYLESDSAGSGFVSLYYKTSPRIAEFIDAHSALKPAVRVALMPAVAVSEAALCTTMAQKIAIVSGLALFSLATVTVFRRRTLNRL